MYQAPPLCGVLERALFGPARMSVHLIVPDAIRFSYYQTKYNRLTCPERTTKVTGVGGGVGVGGALTLFKPILLLIVSKHIAIFLQQGLAIFN